LKLCFQTANHFTTRNCRSFRSLRSKLRKSLFSKSVKVILLYRLLHRPRWKCKALQLACLCVSPSVSMPPFMSQKFQISPNFLCMLPVTVAAGLFNGNSIRCLLPVLWMTSCFRIMGPMGQNQARRYVSLSSPDGGTGGEV